MNYDFYNDLGAINGFMDYNPNKIDLFNPYEGFLVGNAFKNEYIPYQNYKPVKVSINNEKEELLFNINEYSFMMHDMNLYLDNYPNDREALRKFNEFRSKKDELVKNYERKYGPLEVTSSVDNTNFNWVSNWPWVN